MQCNSYVCLGQSASRRCLQDHLLLDGVAALVHESPPPLSMHAMLRRTGMRTRAAVDRIREAKLIFEVTPHTAQVNWLARNRTRLDYRSQAITVCRQHLLL